MEGVRMSRADFEKMLELGTVDVGNGTLFGEAQPRAPRKEGLTLVISTGGSGMSSIREAMRVADQKLEEGYRKYVKFIVVDSSTGEVNHVAKEGIKTLNISSDGAQNRLAEANRDSFFRRFVNKDYNIGLLNSDGSSQDRMTGKIKLYDEAAGDTNDGIFRKMIHELFEKDWSDLKNLPVDIMILSGISGGNGSGTFIDLAVQAKAACPDASKVRVYGYFMLPDTAERFAGTAAAKNNLYRNGFAALKELESYMSMGFEQDRKEMIPARLDANTVTLKATNLPYDYPVLITGDYDNAVSMIAETIVNSIADSGGEFEQKAFYSNILQYRDVALSKKEMCDLGLPKVNACPEDSHMYCGIGYAQASIPEKIVIPNIVSSVCRKLYVPENVGGISDIDTSAAFCSKSKHLNKMEFETQLRKLFGFDNKKELRADALWEKIRGILQNVSRLGSNEWDVDYRDLVNGDYQEYLEGFRVEQVQDVARQKLSDELRKMYSAFMTQAAEVMKVYGPRGLGYLFDGTGDPDEQGKPESFENICVKAQLRGVMDGFIEMAGKPGKYPGPLQQKGLFSGLVESVLKKDADEWKGLATKAAQQDVYSKVASAMTGNNGVWRREYSEKVEKFVNCCMRFADVLETLTDYYTGVGKSLDANDFEEFSKTTGERNGINLCSDAQMYHWVKDTVSAKINSISLSEVKEQLIKNFMEHSELWISDEPGKARKQYDEVMSRVCAIGKYADPEHALQLTITDYFEEILKNVPQANQPVKIKNVVDEVMNKLMTGSEPSLKMLPGSYHHINKIILVPQRLIVGQYGQDIKNAFRQYIGDGDTLAVSSVVDAIVCYQASVANALSDLKDLTLWENGYEAAASQTMHLNNGEHVQLHLETSYSQYRELTKTGTDYAQNKTSEYSLTAEEEEIFGTGLSWRDYPSINTRRYLGGSAARESTTETQYRKGAFEKKVSFALEEGIIECEQEGNVYKYYMNILPRDWDNLRLNGYRQIENGRLKRGRALFDFLKEQNPHSAFSCRRQIKLTGSPVFDESGFDFTEQIRVNHWKPELVNLTHIELMKRMLRKATNLYQEMEDTLYRYCDLYKELKKRDEEVVSTYRAQAFAELFCYGVIGVDDEEYEWNVQINSRGGSKELITFGRRAKAGFTGVEKSMFADGLLLPIVYRRFHQMLEDKEFSLDDLIKLKDEMTEKMSDKQLDQMVDSRVAMIEKAADLYAELFGSAKDPVDEIMEKYNMDDSQLDEADQIDKLFNVAKETAKHI